VRIDYIEGPPAVFSFYVANTLPVHLTKIEKADTVSLSEFLVNATAARCVVCGVWCVVCGVWCVVCGVWCVVCGVWCVVCVV
jgi:hypothetical protein